MSIRNVQGLTAKTRLSSIGDGDTYVRNPSWLTIPTVGSSEQKFVGLKAVFPEATFLAFTVSGNYTVDWGDGVTENVNASTTAYHQYDFTDDDLANTNAPVTFTDSGDLVNRTAHGYTNDMPVQFYNIVSTTGITEGAVYYVINATADSFQISSKPRGSAVALTTDGSATLLPYKQVIVTITPQSGANLTSINLNVKHNQTGLNRYENGWLDVNCGSPNLTTNSFNTSAIYNHMLERVNISSWSSSLTNISGWFQTLYGLKWVSLPNSSAITNTSSLFSGCSNLRFVYGINYSVITNSQNMFLGCYSLKSLEPLNLSASTNTSSMFRDCFNLRNIAITKMTSSAVNAANMFQNCRELYSIDIPATNFNTAAGMFNGCISLDRVKFTPGSSASGSMDSIFTGCNNIREIDLTPINTTAVTALNAGFSNCFKLIKISLGDFDASTNFSTAFQNCYLIKEINLGNCGTTASGNINYTSMFSNCFSLESVSLITKTSGGAHTGVSMFQSDISLKNVSINTSKFANFVNFFNGCASLTNIPKLDVSAGTDFNSMFSGCTSLKELPPSTVLDTTTSFPNFVAGNTSLSRIQWSNIGQTFSVASCHLSATALNELYTNLATVSGKTITVSTNWGTSGDDPTIATNKGWTVTGS